MSDAHHLIDTLLNIYYHGQSPSKAALEKLQKKKYLGPSGKLTEAGIKLLDKWFTRGSDRGKLSQELL